MQLLPGQTVWWRHKRGNYGWDDRWQEVTVLTVARHGVFIIARDERNRRFGRWVQKNTLADSPGGVRGLLGGES